MKHSIFLRFYSLFYYASLKGATGGKGAFGLMVITLDDIGNGQQQWCMYL